VRDCEAVVAVKMDSEGRKWRAATSGENAAGMLVLPGGVARFGWRGDGSTSKISLTHSTTYTSSHSPFFCQLIPNPTLKQLPIMEELKNTFAQCKKEGRVSL
jgi:hypothetical protein